MGKTWDNFPCFLDSDLYSSSGEPTGTIKFSIVVGEKLRGGIWKILEVLGGG